MNKLDWNKIKEYIKGGYISVQQHPTADLRIYNYTHKTQYKSFWNNETKQCRGLITDLDDNIVSRPFSKFFNYGEVKDQIPNEEFEVYEKKDGSLGVLYWIDDKPYLTTRGSFTSEQAKKGTGILQNKYSHVKLNKDYTYLFEIIYPENRIVVDYKDIEDIYLLAIIDTKTGEDLPFTNDIGFPIVEKYDYDNLSEILKIQDKDTEGFVIKYKSGFRVKIKFDEYLRLHRLLTGITARNIWDDLRNKRDMSKLFDHVPDEFHKWVTNKINELENNFKQIEEQAIRDYNTVMLSDDRKIVAEFINNFCDNSPILFMMLDGKDYSEYIYKLIRPKAQKPFKREI